MTADDERRRVRGEAARVFLKAVNYGDEEIAALGDLSRLGPEQVKELLVAKRDQIKTFEDVVSRRPQVEPFDEKPK